MQVVRHSLAAAVACGLCAATLSAVHAAGPAEPLAARLAPVSGDTFRLYEGLTLLIHNSDGKAFDLELDVRDMNLVEPGPREVLLKVYDPEGKTLVREVIPDDGVVTPVGQGPTGGWDHEAWYYTYQVSRGAAPMLNWSGLTAPDRLAAIPVRTVSRHIAGGPKGAYRVVVVGARDHVVSVRLTPALPWAVAGNPFFLHPTGGFLSKRFFAVPKGSQGLNLTLVENDRPRTRRVTLRDAAGTVLCTGVATSGVAFFQARPEKGATWDDQVFSLEVGPGPGAFMLQCSLMIGRIVTPPPRTPAGALPVFLAPDPATARALGGGVIWADGERFFQPQQVRLREWLARIPSNDFVVARADGTPSAIVTLKPALPGYIGCQAYDLEPNRNAQFLPLNGPHEHMPISDTIMFSYDLHRNRAALNVAIRNVADGLRTLGPGDNPLSSTWNGMGNLAYLFGTYSWHWWRPGWRLLQCPDTPAEVKEMLRDAFLNAGDRLAFCRNWERVNGNAFATVVCGLRYGLEGTQDPLHKELFETYYERFTTGGWGPRVGLGPSGLVHEEFAYDHHYGGYPFATWGAVVADLKDPRFIRVHEGFQRFFSYTLNEEVSANPFSARTAHRPDPPVVLQKEGPYAWKGLPGPDFTETVNGGNEFFAARRKGYYILSYHGRMTPKWQNEGFMGQIGWSGGTLCQFVVPGKGTVLAGTLNAPGYGKGMHPSEWRNFHIHSLVGLTADGNPLLSSDTEHLDARLEGNKVTGSGEIRCSSVACTRSYTYNPDHVLAEVSLLPSADDEVLGFWFKSPFRGFVAEAWEMIPFMPQRAGAGRSEKPEDRTSVRMLDAAGTDIGELGDQAVECSAVVVDRGGFGVRIELEKPMPVKRGAVNTVMIQAVAPTPPGPHDREKEQPNAASVSLRYKLVPFGA